MLSHGLSAGLLAAWSLWTLTSASPIHESRHRVAQRGMPQLNLAVYYGQGPNQKRLRDFCADTTMDVIPIGFVNIFPDQPGGNGYPGTNYGNQCGSPYWIANDQAHTQTKMFTTCNQLAEDIPVCQALGKKVLASIGGDSPGLTIASTNSAQSFAQFLWGSFGPNQDPTQTLYPRPFGDVVVDGFDLDIESGSNFGYADLVNELRTLFAGQPKQYYISSAPQCIVPDAHLSDAIQKADFDFIFVQYYNTPQCSARSLFASGSLDPNADPSWGWAGWLAANSKNKNVKLYLGLPASTQAAHSTDYLDLDEAKALIEAYACNSNYQSIFGGVMLWEATFSDNNQIGGQSYAQNIKAIIGGLSCGGPAVTTTTTTTTTVATTTTQGAVVTTTTPAIVVTTTTSTTTTVQYATTTTTASTNNAIGPIGGSTSTTTPWYVGTTTTTNGQVGPIGGTTTTNNQIGPIGGTTTTSTTSTTLIYSLTSWQDWPTTMTTTNTPTIDPAQTSTSTTSTFVWEDWPTTTTTNTATVDPTQTSTSTTSTFVWEDWPTSTSSSLPVDPTQTSTSTMSTVVWEDWSTGTTSSLPVDPTKTSTSTTSTFVWEDWSTATTSSLPVDPTQTSTTSASTYLWEDWETTTTTASPTVDPTFTTTVMETWYIDVCPTGYITKTLTITTSIPVSPASATFDWPIDANGLPQGFFTTITACPACGQPEVYVTVTIPIATTTAAVTQTVVPLQPSVVNPAGGLSTVTAPGSTPVAPFAPVASNVEVQPASTGGKTIGVEPYGTTPTSNSGFMGPAEPSASHVAAVNVSPYKGAAPQLRLSALASAVAVAGFAALVGSLF